MVEGAFHPGRTMAAMSADREAGLKSFLESQDMSILVALLLELAKDHDAVRERLARLQVAAKPAKLAAAFQKTLSAWQRSDRYFAYDESPEFARELDDEFTETMLI